MPTTSYMTAARMRRIKRMNARQELIKRKKDAASKGWIVYKARSPPRF